ncbi:MAG: hypothetical protein KDA58_00055 [Planctomycetaceae bacterium]|nr:hypothetical protein [Planctomycetaceae bacterium]
MGLWDWLFGAKQPTPQVLDRVWFSDAALWANLRKELDTELGCGRHVILVAHFPQRWEQITQWLDQQELEFEDWQPRDWRELREPFASGPGRIWLLPSKDVPNLDPQLDPPGPPLEVTVMATEHHPHAAGDEPLHRLEAGLPAAGGVVVQSAVDHPMFAPMQNLQTILESVGMTEDESIETSIVTRQLARLQQRNARTAGALQPADSAADWIRLNLVK